MINNVVYFHKPLYKLALSGQCLLLRLCQIENKINRLSRIGVCFHDWKVSRKTKVSKGGANMGKKAGSVNVLATPKKGKPLQTRVPSTLNIVVIGTGGPGTSHSLLVTTESSRYFSDSNFVFPCLVCQILTETYAFITVVFIIADLFFDFESCCANCMTF